MAGYVDQAELQAEFMKSKAAGWKWTERFGELVLQLHELVLRRPDFAGYDRDFKEDMRQQSCLKLFRLMKNFDPAKGELFPYLHTAIRFNYWKACLSRYRLQNRRDAYVYSALVGLGCGAQLERVRELEGNPYVMRLARRR